MQYKIITTDKNIKVIATEGEADWEIGYVVVDYKDADPGPFDTIFQTFHPTKKRCFTISAWYVNNKYQHKGIGKELLKKVFLSISPFEISEIKYIWNGANEYVGEWLEKFDARNDCPITFLKNNSEDIWECHLYTLDKDKFLLYLEGK